MQQNKGEMEIFLQIVTTGEWRIGKVWKQVNGTSALLIEIMMQ